MTKLVIPLTEKQGWTAFCWSIRILLSAGLISAIIFNSQFFIIKLGVCCILAFIFEVCMLIDKGAITMRGKSN